MNRFDAKPNQNLIAIRREPLVQLNKDSRNIAATASTYGENALIESQQKKMGLIASENEVCPLNFFKLLPFKFPIIYWARNQTYLNIIFQVPKGCYLSELHQQLGKVVRSNPTTKLPVMEDEAEDPKVSYYICLYFSTSLFYNWYE